MTFSKTGFTALILFTLFSCGNSESPQSTDRKSSLNYFDIRGYMEAEIKKLAQEPSFNKSVYVNGEKETKRLESIDLENELTPFIDSDINKPAWAGKYDVDSTFNQAHQLIGLHYQSKDRKLKTKSIAIDFEGTDVSKIFIVNAVNSSVANTYQTLTYQPQKGFSIESKQDVSLMAKNHFKIEVAFQ